MRNALELKNMAISANEHRERTKYILDKKLENSTMDLLLAKADKGWFKCSVSVKGVDDLQIDLLIDTLKQWGYCVFDNYLQSTIEVSWE